MTHFIIEIEFDVPEEKTALDPWESEIVTRITDYLMTTLHDYDVAVGGRIEKAS